MATKAMMAATFEKPRRFEEGTSGCILRGDRGPLVAGWGARLVRSEKARSMCRQRWPRRRPLRMRTGRGTAMDTATGIASVPVAVAVSEGW